MQLLRLDESLWGKERGLDPDLPPYPLVRHLLDAAAMAGCLWDTYLSANQRAAVARSLKRDEQGAREIVVLCAALHDLGKISDFQFCSSRACGYLSADLAKGRKFHFDGGHDKAGMLALAVVLPGLGIDTSERTLGRRIAEIVGGHHGVFHKCDHDFFENPARQQDLGPERWAEQRAAHAEAVYGLLGRPSADGRFEAPGAVLVTGVVILADWLVSQEGYLRKRQRQLSGDLEQHYEESVQDAPGLLDQARLRPVSLRHPGFAAAYDLDGAPNPLQRSITEELPGAVRAAKGDGGILLITAAPGDGKTEAALEAVRVFAERSGSEGFAFLLPTMATSDKMYERVRDAVANQQGSAAGLTLTHSMAWLSEAYEQQDLSDPDVLVCEDGDLQGKSRAGEPPRVWLHGAKRPLLAQFAVGTIDQALMSILPVKHNALRLLALSGKTFVVDEAHAYDPYMQVLLGRLLNWLGAYGVPVVLLSATLPCSVSDRLIKEYLLGQGKGFPPSKLKKRTFRAPYPGWLFVDAAGQETAISDGRQKTQAADRRMDLCVRTIAVRHDDGPRSRLGAIKRLVKPITEDEGGTALIVCNTVAQAQETYEALAAEFKDLLVGDPKQLHLLHARFPAEDRESLTNKVTKGLGRDNTRPERRIVVATQVVEQSLDLDADIVISDLAPLALLLQRAGRCWRHETWWQQHGYPGGRGRPGWATGPELVVLDPLADGGSTPGQWGDIYSDYFLQRTSEVLADIQQIAVPEQVQELVEHVHGDGNSTTEPGGVHALFDWDAPEKSEHWSAHVGKDLADRGLARLNAIPRATEVAQLARLHEHELNQDERDIATRLGADSVRLLCVYEHKAGLTFDPKGTRPVPAQDGIVPSRDEIRTIMRRTILVPMTWFTGEPEKAHAPLPGWAEHTMLQDLKVLRFPLSDGAAQPLELGGRSVRLDDVLGLVREPRQ